MKLKDVAKIAMFLSILIILAQPIFALGVTPARTVVDFEPSLKKSVTIKVTNNEQKDFKVIAYVRGELINYTDIKEKIITIKRTEQYKEFTYDVILPKNMKMPGIHKSEIVLIELQEFEAEEQIVITASASVVSELIVRVPYPEKYAEAQFHISGDVKEETRFVIPIFNYGKENIESVKAKIRILGATYEEVALLETNEISVNTKQEGKLVASWKAEVNPGMYHAVAEIEYDGKPIKLEKNFGVGDLLIEIKDIKVNDFKLGGIARLDIYLKSKWNQPIESIYADVVILDKDQEIYTFKTNSINLQSLSEGKLEAYWDTKGISVGRYNTKISLNYAGKITEKLLELQVNIDSINTGLTAEVIAPGEGIDKNTILVTLVIIMIAINIGWLIYIKKMKKK